MLRVKRGIMVLKPSVKYLTCTHIVHDITLCYDKKTLGTLLADIKTGNSLTTHNYAFVNLETRHIQHHTTCALLQSFAWILCKFL